MLGAELAEFVFKSVLNYCVKDTELFLVASGGSLLLFAT